MNVLLQGGLGNTMFQWAFGRSLSLRRGLPLGREKRVIAPKVWFTGLDYRDCVPERWERL